MMQNGWTPLETTKHQDHVIAHVVGAAPVAYFVFDEAAYLLLDIGFIWQIYLNGEMGLLPSAVAIRELEASEETRRELLAEAELVESQGRDVQGLKRMTIASVDCSIKEVALFANDDRRRLVISCEEEECFVIETSLATSQITLRH